MKSYKIRIPKSDAIQYPDTPHPTRYKRKDIHELVQNHAFKLGWSWSHWGNVVKFTDEPFLFFHEDGSIVYEYNKDYFDSYRLAEISPQDFLKLTKEDVCGAELLNQDEIDELLMANGPDSDNGSEVLTESEVLMLLNAVEKQNNPVTHPRHYTDHPSGIECIQVTEHFNFNLGNVIKYIWRADLKGYDLQDLEKAAWYLNREIEKRKKSE